MDIIINSLYSNKDIFLRELISNSADALDKIRFLSVSDKDALKDESNLEIRISIDRDNNILTIKDTGIGMSKEDLISHLGTIARSGTAAFLEQAQRGGDLNLIGQFGVGFYSVYLVADYVEVITKSNNDTTQWIWESQASGTFAISEDKEVDSRRLGRGTQINIHLKESCLEYLQETKLQELVERYSEFINFPIHLLTEKNVTTEVPVEEGEEEDGGEKDSDEKQEGDEIEVSEDDEDKEEKKPKTKSVTELVKEWKILNDNQALWLRPPGDVSDEDYTKFYQALTKAEKEEPLAHSHFRAEGDVDFKAVLYVPPNAPFEMSSNYYTSKPRVKLYVRRVFISDSFEDLLPKWLSFMVGLVDSDSMPLNVSREMLQLNEGLKVIKKKLIRKALDMLKRLSDVNMEWVEKEAELEAAGKVNKKKGDKKKDSDDDDDKEALKDDLTKEEEELKKQGAKYRTAWGSFSKPIKMGIIEDHTNRRRLLPLLRFYTNKSFGTLTNLDAYISRMKEGQKKIYYLVGTDKDELVGSPFVDHLAEQGFEIIFFTDPLDEYVMTNVYEYEEKSFVNVSKDDSTDETKDDDVKKREKLVRIQYKNVTKWWKDSLGKGAGITTVKVSTRLTSTPCVVVSSKFGWSATMEKIAMAQALGSSDPSRAAMQRGARTLEINPRHPVVRQLKDKMDQNPDDPDVVEMVKVLTSACLLDSGYMLTEAPEFKSSILHLLKGQLAIDDLKPLSLEDLDDSLKDVEEAEKARKEAEKAASSSSDGKGSGTNMRDEDDLMDIDPDSEVHDMIRKMKDDLAKEEAEKAREEKEEAKKKEAEKKDEL